MNKHDNIYNILGKLASLEPAPAKPQSVLKELHESTQVQPSVTQRLNEKYEGWKNTFKSVGLPESEQKTMSRAAKGHEKYGKEGMQALAKAGRNGAGEKELDKIRDRHNKYDESVEVDEDMLSKKDYDGDGKKETPKAEYMGSRDKAIKKAMGKTKEEGNEFSGELAKARAQGKDSFEVDGKSYSVKESDGDVVPGKSWIKDPSDPDSKIPAYRRKETEPGRQAAQAAADAANAKVGAKVFRPAKSARPSDVEEDQYNEDDAHSSLPGIRKTTKEEHSEYDAAAHTVRKWMRKRGWNTHEEFKPALKYIMDNLEDTHDDSLTDQVKEAAKICEKHHMAVAEAGLKNEASNDSEGPADLLAAVEQEIARPGRSTDNLRDVLNATFGSDRSPEFKKARAVIGKYLDLLDNAAIGSEQDGISPMRGGNIARHIQQYDLTDYLQHAAAMLDKKGPMSEAGLDMNLLKGAQGAMRGANTDPESERNRGKPYGYRTDRDDTGNDDDYDEHGNEKKGVKKSAPSDGPKKKGRPRKNFGPERTTAKAYKHKGARVSESINLETYVEDVMEELEAMFIIEKAKSKSQQKFMGMVYAAKKGEKPASKEVAKAAKGMSKKDAEDFAKTKHKGLPDKVTEGVNFAEMVKETGQTVEEMLMELNMEMEEFKRSGRLGDKLRDALDLHRHGKNLMDMSMTPPSASAMPAMTAEDSLDELALLAGLHGGQKKLDKNKDGKLTAMDFEMLRGERKDVDESSCNMTAEGQYCEVHGMDECGSMMESGGYSPNQHPQTKDYGKGAEDLPFEPDLEPMGDKDQFGNTIKHKARHLARIGMQQAMSKKVKEDLQADDGQHYRSADDFFSQFEADHFDNEEESDDGMEVRGYIDGVNVMTWRFDDESKTSGYGVYNDDALGELDETNHFIKGIKRFIKGKANPSDVRDKHLGKMAAAPYDVNVQDKEGKRFDKVQSVIDKAAGYEKEVNECGMGPIMPEEKSGMNINTSMDTKTGRKTVTVTADGDAAEELAHMLKMAGMIGAIKQDQGLDEYANEPQEVYGTTDAIMRQGNDLNRPKSQYADKAKLGDNPMATVESKLNELYQAMKQGK